MTTTSSAAGEDGGDRDPVGRVIRELRDEGETPDAREPPSDHAEIERRDPETRKRPRRNSSPGGQYAREDKRPAERECEVGRDSGCEQAHAPLLVGKKERSRGERRLERVAVRQEGVQRRGPAARERRDGASDKSVASGRADVLAGRSPKSPSLVHRGCASLRHA